MELAPEDSAATDPELEGDVDGFRSPSLATLCFVLKVGGCDPKTTS